MAFSMKAFGEQYIEYAYINVLVDKSMLWSINKKKVKTIDATKRCLIQLKRVRYN